MARLINEIEPVYVVGVGWHRYQPLSDTPYVELGLKAIRDALADANATWDAVDETYVATALLGMAVGQPMLRHLGAKGKPVVHIENASASGSAAFRHACMGIGSGLTDVALVVGVDKPRGFYRAPTGIGQDLAQDAILPFTHFALLTEEYADRFGLSTDDIARVAVKNSANGAKNPNAHRQQARTLDEILGSRRISGPLTTLQCCPVGEGAAAVVVASREGLQRLGVDPARAVRVIGSTARTECAGSSDQGVSADTISQCLREAKLSATDLDVIEVHDAFPIEELQYSEAVGICPEGHYIPLLKEGAFDIGGRCAISPSGGLLAMGHPTGPTGVGQIGELTLQLRGDAGARQQPGARHGLAHMVGVGGVCYGHILRQPD